eukprot:1551387-Lingulodinium_polyedra.AAC.1
MVGRLSGDGRAVLSRNMGHYPLARGSLSEKETLCGQLRSGATCPMPPRVGGIYITQYMYTAKVVR